jgi:pimeloyl-ACP methyl ester carboxylesterase
VEVRSADGTRIHAEVFGRLDAPTIVLAHGITCALRSWHGQIKDLAGDYRVVAYDQRGHGRSARPYRASSLTGEALADDLQAVLEQCVPDARPVVLAGHSMGGIAIMAWAQKYPDEVRRRAGAVALVNTAAHEVLQHTGGVHAPASTHLVIRRVAVTGVRTPILPGMGPALRWLAFGAQPRPTDVALLARMVNNCPGRTRGALARSLIRTDLRPGLAHLDVPAALIAGRDDRLLPASVHSAAIARGLPQLVSYETLPGVGHMAPLESREYVSWCLADLAERYAGRPRKRR